MPTLPQSPLCRSKGRAGSQPLKVSEVAIRHTPESRWPKFAPAEQSRAVRRRSSQRRPPSQSSRKLSSPVRSASTQFEAGRPVSPSSPLGMSMARTQAPSSRRRRLNDRIDSAISPRGSPRAPIPSRPSRMILSEFATRHCPWDSWQLLQLFSSERRQARLRVGKSQIDAPAPAREIPCCDQCVSRVVTLAAKHAAKPRLRMKLPHNFGNSPTRLLHQILSLNTPGESGLFGAFHLCASNEHISAIARNRESLRIWLLD